MNENTLTAKEMLLELHSANINGEKLLKSAVEKQSTMYIPELNRYLFWVYAGSKS